MIFTNFINMCVFIIEIINNKKDFLYNTYNVKIEIVDM